MSKDKYLRPHKALFLLVGEGAADKPETWYEGPDHPALLFRPLTVGEVQTMGREQEEAGEARVVDITTDAIATGWVGVRGEMGLALSPLARALTTGGLAKLSNEERGSLLRRVLMPEELAGLGELIKALSSVGREEKNASKT